MVTTGNQNSIIQVENQDINIYRIIIIIILIVKLEIQIKFNESKYGKISGTIQITVS